MNAETDAKAAGKCPFSGSHGPSNRHWWPQQLDVQVLHTKSKRADPMGESFDYAKEFKTLDLNAVARTYMR